MTWSTTTRSPQPGARAAEYLSGDVRTKLDAATEAAALDERYAVNVEALREVLPDSIGVDEI
ncbi:MAG TPA: hypothetical protein VE198_19430, partial [Actinoallomurus sp.]|nr:hypothetical protein [Actinoallomurus sp.]